MSHWVLATAMVAASGTAMAAEPVPTPVDETGVQDIVVTAARRSENVQRTAISIQAVSGAELVKKGISRPEDLSAIAPGVSVATGGNYPQTYIRGVGNYAATVYAEGAVAYNIDGVYVSRGWAVRGAFFDLERAEILKGPQGTLYGRNASGGALNFITVRPRLGETSGYAEAEAGNYDLRRGAAAVNLPLGETLALRASGQIIDRDGYLSDGSDDEKSQAARLHLLWQPDPDLSVLVTGGYQHIGGRGPGSVVTPRLPGSWWRAISDPAVVAIVRAEPGIGPLLAGFGRDQYVDIDVYSIGGELNWDLGPATLTVLPAYRKGKINDHHFVPGFGVDANERDRQTTLEARLGGDQDGLKWVLGGYYFLERQGNQNGKPSLFVQQGVNTQFTPQFDSKTLSYAGFGQVTGSITDRLRLTGGLRYTYERKQQAGVTSAYGFPNMTPPPCPAGTFDPATPSPPLFCRIDAPLTGRLTYRSWTWKAGVEYDVAPASMFYANASTGFKSGGFFAAPVPNTFRPEKITAFDAGIKNRFLDNRLQVNAEIFYWRYKDHQESHIGPTSIPNFFAFITENAGSAKSYGGDLDILFKPTRADTLTLKVQYNKTRYNSFVYSNQSDVFGPPVTNCAVGAPVNGVQLVDCAGFQLVRSPEWTGVAGYNHEFSLGRGDVITAGVSTQFSSSSYLSIDFLDDGKQRSYATLDADLSYTAPNGRFSLSGYVRNITREGILTQVARYPFVSPNNPLARPDGLIIGSIRPPRTTGVRLRVNF